MIKNKKGDKNKMKKPIAVILAAALVFSTNMALPALTTDQTPVFAEEAEEPAPSQANVKQLSYDLIKYNEYVRVCRQIPNETQEGMYFLNGEKLLFYSFATEEITTPYTFSNVTDTYEADNKLYVLESEPQAIQIYNLDNMELEKTISLSLSATKLGVDGQGRIYLSAGSGDDTTIYLLSAEGEQLSSAKAPDTIYGFSGFDDITGNFYFECAYSQTKWGYHYDTHALSGGTVSGNTLSVCEDIFHIVSQNGPGTKQRMADLIGGRYLCVDTTFYATKDIDEQKFDGLFIWDSNKSVLTGDEPTLAKVASMDRTTSWSYYSSLGSRCVYHEKDNGIIAYVDDDTKTLVEYDPEREVIEGTYHTAYPVFYLDWYKGSLVAIEQDNITYYIEFIDWKQSDKLEIQGNATTVEAGSDIQLTAESNGTINETFEWESADPRIASVSNNGTVFGWNEGTTQITVKSSVGLTATYQIEVTAAPKRDSFANVMTLSGQTSSNVSANDYYTYGKLVNSYLMENEDGTLTRVENMADGIVVETYNKDTGALLDTKKIDVELGYFGGFYSGEDANYLVFGDVNADEVDTKEIMRVVKYSKDWNRLAQASVNGANTYIAFDAGSLRMTETGGQLYVYTCHEMYKTDDGYHHQSNMIFVIDEESMEVVDSNYEVMNIAATGYISHSFNQFIQTDGEYLYRVDHGDSYPRAVSIVKSKVGDRIKNVTYTLPFLIIGEGGDNYTGVSVGDMQLGSGTCLIAGNSIVQDINVTQDGQRNIFLTVTDQETFETKEFWFTNYTGNTTQVRTPHLVKLGANQFLLLWEEYKSASQKTVTKLVTIDSQGNQTSGIVKTSMRLSDCDPIVTSDGLVRWYQSDGESVTLYAVDPMNLSAVGEEDTIELGDVNEDGVVNLKDAQLVLRRYLKIITADQAPDELCDVDGNGKVNLADTQLILKKYLKLIDEFPAAKTSSVK